MPLIYFYMSVCKNYVYLNIYIYNCFYTKNNLKQIRESFVLKVIDRRRRNTNVSVCVCWKKRRGKKREREAFIFNLSLYITSF